MWGHVILRSMSCSVSTSGIRWQLSKPYAGCSFSRHIVFSLKDSLRLMLNYTQSLLREKMQMCCPHSRVFLTRTSWYLINAYFFNGARQPLEIMCVDGWGRSAEFLYRPVLILDSTHSLGLCRRCHGAAENASLWMFGDGGSHSTHPP